MLATAGTSLPAVDPTAPQPRRVLGDIPPRAAGVGALAFVAVVVLQNFLRGGSAPANGASSESVLSHYADHRTITFVLTATFVASGVGLAVFLGGAMRRLVASSRPSWAFTGFVGATGVMALFAVVVGIEQALSVVATGDSPNLGAVEALWALHNSVFAVLMLLIGVALLGLARAGVAAGITPRVFDRLAPVGFGLLALGTIGGPSIAAGDALPLFGLSLVGFGTWLAFLVTTGLRLVRSQVAGTATSSTEVSR
jgi:hypothetical protein